jgi:integrase
MKVKRKKTALGQYIAQACAGMRATNPHAQLNWLLENIDMKSRRSGDREVSDKTRTEFGNSGHQFLRILKNRRRGVQCLDQLGRSHAVDAARYMVEEEFSGATIQTFCSHLRRLYEEIGKPTAVPEGKEWIRILEKEGIDTSRLKRCKVATEDKSWEGNGVDFFEIVEKVRAFEPLQAVRLEAQLAFGLRATEACELDPIKGDCGEKILVLYGAKNGHVRVVELDADEDWRKWQREVIARASGLAKGHRKQRLADPEKDLKQNRNHYYYVLRKFGICKAKLGVGSHGLRHQFAHRRYQQNTGLPAPVKGEVPPDAYKVNPEAMREGQRKLSLDLGHYRPDITSAYCGSPQSAQRQAKERQREIVSKLQASQDLMAAAKHAKVERLWIVGRLAHGLRLADCDAIEFVVKLIGAMDDVSPSVANMTCALEAALGRRATVAVAEVEPGRAIEVVLP